MGRLSTDDLDAIERTADCEAMTVAHGIAAIGELLAWTADAGELSNDAARNIGWLIKSLGTLSGRLVDVANGAERRSGNWVAGSPLYEASFSATVEFIRTAPDGTLPDPFAPGEIFGPKLPPVLRVVRAD